jgi:glycosyltransferase 2 family protein
MPEQNPSPTLESAHEEVQLWRWPTVMSLAIMLVILLGLGAMLDIQETWRQVVACDKTLMALGGVAHYVTYLVRGYRWQRCLAQVSRPYQWRMFGLLLFFANGVDNVVPGKLADVYTAHLARINCGVRRSTALGALVFLRMVDAWVVLLLAALASWWLFATSLPRAVLWSLLLGVCVAGGVTLVLLACVLSKIVLPTWIPARGQQMLHAFHIGMWPPSSQLGHIIVLTSLIWGLESVWTISLAAAFGIKVCLMQGMFLTMIPLLATALPLTPSGVGVVEVTMYSCLRLLDVSTATAASWTVVHRLIDYWLHIGVGALLWAFRRPIGLRTWLEVSPPDAPGTQSSQRSPHKGIAYGA